MQTDEGGALWLFDGEACRKLEGVRHTTSYSNNSRRIACLDWGATWNASGDRMVLRSKDGFYVADEKGVKVKDIPQTGTSRELFIWADDRVLFIQADDELRSFDISSSEMHVLWKTESAVDRRMPRSRFLPAFTVDGSALVFAAVKGWRGEILKEYATEYTLRAWDLKHNEPVVLQESVSPSAVSQIRLTRP